MPSREEASPISEDPEPLGLPHIGHLRVGLLPVAAASDGTLGCINIAMDAAISSTYCEEKKKKGRRDYIFRRQVDQKPVILPGCPGTYCEAIVITSKLPRWKVFPSFASWKGPASARLPSSEITPLAEVPAPLMSLILRATGGYQPFEVYPYPSPCASPWDITGVHHHLHRVYPNSELMQVSNSLSSAVMHSKTAPLSDVKVQGWGDPLRPMHRLGPCIIAKPVASAIDCGMSEGQIMSSQTVSLADSAMIGRLTWLQDHLIVIATVQPDMTKEQPLLRRIDEHNAHHLQHPVRMCPSGIVADPDAEIYKISAAHRRQLARPHITMRNAHSLAVILSKVQPTSAGKEVQSAAGEVGDFHQVQPAVHYSSELTCDVGKYISICAAVPHIRGDDSDPVVMERGSRVRAAGLHDPVLLHKVAVHPSSADRCLSSTTITSHSRLNIVAHLLQAPTWA
ncbi:MAG: hypothetical protein FRX49_12828, partial [Trebouxia sp. A1-2]